MSEGILKRMRLSGDSVEYIEDYAREKGFPDGRMNRTVDLIIQEHKEMRERKENEQETGNEMIQEVSDSVSKEMKKEVKRILLGTNNADRNTQILIELLNGLMIHNNISDIVTTDDMESKPVTTAKENVQDRIKHLQQKRADYYTKQGGQ
ncbi:hypothetical protein [Alteribacillus bidgolensis]|uniref:Uncharacterized protein n=1 Tax=Alteribacillus bidgolensis TaxID=930129 RepID=A0A1G8Q8F7_9BACI|nr:hypothetical protein [Alteribacillus bidgolensis]SDJ00390.1 hypothetical protein SAMN05216352_11820 [Alteribacillus bidgolensis]